MHAEIAIVGLCFLSGKLAVDVDFKKMSEGSTDPSRSSIEKFCPDCVSPDRYGGKASTAVSERREEVPELRGNTFLVALKPGLQPFVEGRHTDNPGGFVGKLMDLLEDRANITVKYVWLPYNGDLLKFIEGEGQRIALDLKANPKIMTERSRHIFMMQQGVWIVTQKKDDKSQNVLTGNFTKNYFLQLILLTIFTLVIIYASRDPDRTRIVLRLYGMFLGNGVGWLPKRWFLRFLIILWCFSTYVIVQMYFSILTSQLTSANTNLVIRNAEELVKSGIEILCTENIKDLYCGINENYAIHICEKCSLISIRENWKAEFDNVLENLTGEFFAFNTDSLIFKRNYNKKPFVMVPEGIGMWPSLLYVSRDVGLKHLKEIQYFFCRLFESGIIKQWMEQHVVKKPTNDDLVYGPSNMSQMKNVFVILFAGWVCSFVVYIIERLVSRYRTN